MKNLVFLFLAFLFSCCSFSQDTLVYLNNTIQVGKVLEVNISTVKFIKSEIVSGPIYEISKDDLICIKYPGGYIDVIDNAAMKYYEMSRPSEQNSVDTINFAKIYIVFNDGSSDNQKFPLFFNNSEICNLKNQSRVEAIVYSEGLLKVERFNGKKHGPTVTLKIMKGLTYGLEVIINDPYGLDPSHRFHLIVYDGIDSVKYFLDNKYYGFKPFKNRDLYFEEDLSKPWK